MPTLTTRTYTHTRFMYWFLQKIYLRVFWLAFFKRSFVDIDEPRNIILMKILVHTRTQQLLR